MPLTSPGNDDDTGENHQPTLRKNTAEPVEQTLKQNNEWLAWADKLKANGETVTSTRAVADGLAPSTTTAKRRLHTLRREHPGRF